MVGWEKHILAEFNCTATKRSKIQWKNKVPVLQRDSIILTA